MLRKTLLFIIFPLLVIIVAVTLTAHLVSAPARFTVQNLNSTPVKVVARWHDKTKNIGPIPPNTTTEFFVEDEATMTFEITRSNGTAVTVGDIYFASNTSIQIEITQTSVQVKSSSK